VWKKSKVSSNSHGPFTRNCPKKILLAERNVIVIYEFRNEGDRGLNKFSEICAVAIFHSKRPSGKRCTTVSGS
jgi:tRNA (Thr-GGU) A37 N-methylase